MDPMARDSYEPRAPLPDIYDEEPRMLKRRRSISPRRGPDHYEPARQRSPRMGAGTVNGYTIDPTRTDPDYLAWIARQRAREEERRGGPQGWAGGDDDWERNRWRDERGFDEPPHMRGGFDDDRYAPRMRPEDDWDRAPSRGRSYRDDDPYGPGGPDRRGAYPGSGYPGGRDARPLDPLDHDGLLPFKRYAQLLRESGHEPAALSSSPAASAELYEKYTAYRSTYQSRAMRRFFDEHREQPWFVEKYGIGESDVAARTARRKRGRVGTKARWLEELRSGKLDQVCLDVKLASPELLATLEGGLAAHEGKGLLATTTRDGEAEVLHDPDTAVTPANPHEVMIRSVPVELPRADLEAALAKLPGFQYLAMGEPHQSKRYGRMGWVVFDADTNMSDAISSLNSLPIGDGKLTYETTDRAAHARMRIAPPQASALPRLAHDLRQARDLVATLEREDRKLWHEELDAMPVDGAAPEELAWLDVDASAEIEQRCAHLDVGRGELGWEEIERQAAGGQPAPRAEGEEEPADKPEDLPPARLREILTKHLDLHLDLLRYVWHCDYYATIMCDFAEELVRRAPRHLRRVESSLQMEKGWANSLDEKHQLWVSPQTVDVEFYGGRNLEKELQDLAAPYSQLDEAEKHRCIVPVTPAEGDTAEVLCNKPFRAAIFVRKHVVNKHRAFLDQIAGNKIRDIEAYNAYILDPARTMPTLQAPGTRDGSRQSGAGQPRGTPQLASRIGMPRNQSFDSPGMLGNLPMHAPPLSLMNVGSGGMGMPMGMGVPVPFAAAGAQFGPLIRMGGSVPVQDSPVAARRGARASERSEAPLGSRLGPAPPANDLVMSEPLPEPPRPLDPRARGAPKRYEDLDSAGDGEAGELALEY